MRRLIGFSSVVIVCWLMAGCSGFHTQLQDRDVEFFSERTGSVRQQGSEFSEKFKEKGNVERNVSKGEAILKTEADGTVSILFTLQIVKSPWWEFGIDHDGAGKAKIFFNEQPSTATDASGVSIDLQEGRSSDKISLGDVERFINNGRAIVQVTAENGQELVVKSVFINYVRQKPNIVYQEQNYFSTGYSLTSWHYHNHGVLWYYSSRLGCYVRYINWWRDPYYRTRRKVVVKYYDLFYGYLYYNPYHRTKHHRHDRYRDRIIHTNPRARRRSSTKSWIAESRAEQRTRSKVTESRGQVSQNLSIGKNSSSSARDSGKVRRDGSQRRGVAEWALGQAKRIFRFDSNESSGSSTSSGKRRGSSSSSSSRSSSSESSPTVRSGSSSSPNKAVQRAPARSTSSSGFSTSSGKSRGSSSSSSSRSSSSSSSDDDDDDENENKKRSTSSRSVSSGKRRR